MFTGKHRRAHSAEQLMTLAGAVGPGGAAHDLAPVVDAEGHGLGRGPGVTILVKGPLFQQEPLDGIADATAPAVGPPLGSLGLATAIDNCYR